MKRMTCRPAKARAQVEYGGGQRGDGGGDTGGDYSVAAARCGNRLAVWARHYRHYDFLLALTDHLQPNGLEHHESSDNRVPERTLHDPDIMERRWICCRTNFFILGTGKYRRPAGLRRRIIRSQCGESCCGFMKD